MTCCPEHRISAFGLLWLNFEVAEDHLPQNTAMRRYWFSWDVMFRHFCAYFSVDCIYWIMLELSCCIGWRRFSSYLSLIQHPSDIPFWQDRTRWKGSVYRGINTWSLYIEERRGTGQFLEYTSFTIFLPYVLTIKSLIRSTRLSAQPRTYNCNLRSQQYYFISLLYNFSFLYLHYGGGHL